MGGDCLAPKGWVVSTPTQPPPPSHPPTGDWAGQAGRGHLPLVFSEYRASLTHEAGVFAPGRADVGTWALGGAGAWVPEEVGRASPTGNDGPAQPGGPPSARWLAAVSSQ